MEEEFEEEMSNEELHETLKEIKKDLTNQLSNLRRRKNARQYYLKSKENVNGYFDLEELNKRDDDAIASTKELRDEVMREISAVKEQIYGELGCTNYKAWYFATHKDQVYETRRRYREKKKCKL